MNVRPAGREACSCASPYNSILERLTAMEAEILTAMQEANTAVGIANTALSQVQAAGIRTVNQIPPDADGEFSITAGSGIQINAGTNGLEIENTSQGTIYTGISPIQINTDNEISIKDFVKYEDTDWSVFNNGGILTEDILIRAHFQHSEMGTFDKTFYHRKGENITNCADILGISSYNASYPAIYSQFTGGVYFFVVNALTNATRFYSTHSDVESVTLNAGDNIYENVRLGPSAVSYYLYKNTTGNYFAEIYRRV